MSAETCAGEACETCVLGAAPSAGTAETGCCGGGDAGTASAEDRAVLAASGVAIALVAAVLAVTGGGAAAVLAGAGAVAGVALAVLGGVALRRGGALGDRLTAIGTRLLPAATGVLLLALLARAAAAVLG